MSMKNYNDTTENRTRNLLACSAMPQQTAPLGCAPALVGLGISTVECFGSVTRVFAL
jgi:hypothetical protein